MRCTVLLIINLNPSDNTRRELHNRLLLGDDHALYIDLLHHGLLRKRVIVCLVSHCGQLLLVKNNLVLL